MEIRFENVCYKKIFKDLDFSVDSSKVIGITGKNGSGKTSLLNLIYGLDIDFNGKIYIDKYELYNKTSEKDIEKIRKQISYLKQDSDYNYRVVLEELKLVDGFDVEKLNELLELFNLKEEKLHKRDFELTKGELQKVLIIKTLLKNSNLILLDDPTKYIEQKSILNLVKVLKRKKREGCLLIISSLDSEFLLRIVDKIICINSDDISIYSNKYSFFSEEKMLDKINLKMPEIVNFKVIAEHNKKVKLINRDNTNDLIKDIYRNVK